jgi:predicted metal-binding membrane protein
VSALALQRLGWHHPEAGAALVVAGAWTLVLVPVVGGPAAREAHSAAHAAAPFAAGAAAWVLMVVAMMVPTALPVARFHALNALWRRRTRTVALFLGGYVAVWVAFGTVAVPLGAFVPLGAALLAAAAWELTPLKWRALRGCHLPEPLPPRGARADAACVRAGLRYGRRCAVACWPAMLAMAVAGHDAVGLMALLAAVLLVEKLAPRPGRLALPAFGVFAAAAVVAVVAA